MKLKRAVCDFGEPRILVILPCFKENNVPNEIIKEVLSLRRLIKVVKTLMSILKNEQQHTQVSIRPRSSKTDVL